MPRVLAGDAPAGVLGVDGVGIVDVTEDRSRPGMDHRLDAGKGCQRGHQDLVAGLEFAGHGLGHVQQVDGGRPGTGQDDVLHAEVRGQFLLERLALGAEDIVAALDDLQDSAVDHFALVNARKRDFARDRSGRLGTVTWHRFLHEWG